MFSLPLAASLPHLTLQILSFICWARCLVLPYPWRTARWVSPGVKPRALLPSCLCLPRSPRLSLHSSRRQLCAFGRCRWTQNFYPSTAVLPASHAWYCTARCVGGWPRYTGVANTVRKSSRRTFLRSGQRDYSALFVLGFHLFRLYRSEIWLKPRIPTTESTR